MISSVKLYLTLLTKTGRLRMCSVGLEIMRLQKRRRTREGLILLNMVI